MTPSAGDNRDDLVPRMPAVRRARFLRRAAGRANRQLMIAAAAMLVVNGVSGPAQAVALSYIVDGVVDGQPIKAMAGAVMGCLALAALRVSAWSLVDIPGILGLETGIELERQTLLRTARMPGLHQLERPAYLDQVELVRTGATELMTALFTLARSASLTLRMAISLWLLATVHPLLVLVPVIGCPSLIAFHRGQRHMDRAADEAVEETRAADALHQLFLQPTAAMEMRIFQSAAWLGRRSDEHWRRATGTKLRGAMRAARASMIGWLLLTTGYGTALLLVANQVRTGAASVGDFLLVSQLLLQLRGNLLEAHVVGRSTANSMRVIDRFLWLEDLANAEHARYRGKAPAPNQLTDGIRFDHVSFTYPGTSTAVLSDLCLHLPAGSTVAIVGDNGAGKSSLVKLLAGLYQPCNGRIIVDGKDLADLDIDGWRRKLSATFQDFLRLEGPARYGLGIGNIRSMYDDEELLDALERATSTNLTDNWRAGLDTHIGTTHETGIDLSGGEWQRIAIARAMMRSEPLCLILDEPTAALDPVGEDTLFERYAQAARRVAGSSGITIIITHRFSSARTADLIAVLQRGRITEHGTHEDLLRADGDYAAQFRLHADAYRQGKSPRSSS